MKRIIVILMVISTNVFCQDYINVQLTSTTKHGLLDDISKITFNAEGTVINFEMTIGGTDSENLDDILKITFDSEALGDVSLPVELQDFRAIQSGDDVRLSWETASEVNNYGFEIERIHADSEWEKIGFREGKCSCTKLSSYTFLDKKVSKYGNLRYRLKQIDYDGSHEYSPEISVTCAESTIPAVFRIHNNYPNPFNPATTLSYEIAEPGLTKITIYDMQGKEVDILLNTNQQPGRYELKFDGSQLSNGIYFCKFASGINTKIIKMLLVK
ncbi:MAG: T9SS type A sorting domain-containing protein [Candidatus Marinimicrobia bacterium]|nr:T9SS type A sorting domain-containing protein [Candidatus Neomarinimicrobiota bacterium]MCK9484106.1 T9SS type A sorting domain-containing protein [Candidatus Neomarinimicrobiota bacterium]